jgi:uncharacterized protein YbjT (DUF2867 family)
MRVAIAGGHGQIALRLQELLTARGDESVGLIRDPEHAEDLRSRGATPVVCDLESAPVEDVAKAVRGADAVVFAAGAGPGSSAERKLTVDRDGAIKLLEAARTAGVERYVMISAVGAEAPPAGDEVFAVYLRAKADADAAVAASDRAWTIIRPGGLTNDPGTGSVHASIDPYRGQVTRDDVAAVVAAVLAESRLAGVTFYLNGGDDPIASALTALVA